MSILSSFSHFFRLIYTNFVNWDKNIDLFGFFWYNASTYQHIPDEREKGNEMIRCGIAETDITPSLGMEMPGQYKKRIAQGLLTPLAATALYLDNGKGKTLFVSCDAYCVPTAVCRSVRTAAKELFDIPCESIVICATKTCHGGPVIDMGDFCRQDEFYLSLMASRILDAATLAIADARDVTLGFGEGEEETLHHYRYYYTARGTATTRYPALFTDAPCAVVNPALTVLRIDNADGTPYGALVHFACSPHLENPSLDISADFPHYLKDTFRKVYGNGFHPMFIGGFCADVRPDGHPTAHIDPASVGRRFAGEAIRVYESIRDMTSDAVIASCEKTLELCTRLPDSNEEERAEQILADPDAAEKDLYFAAAQREVKKNGIDTKRLSVQALRVHDATFFTLPANTFVNYSLTLKEKTPQKFTLTVNNANGYFGHIVHYMLFMEGIDEANVTPNSCLCKDAGFLAVEKLVEMSEQLHKIKA